MSNDCFGCSDAFGGLPGDVSLDVASTVGLVLEAGVVGDLLAEVLSIHSNLIRDFHEGDLIAEPLAIPLVDNRQCLLDCP